MKKSRTVLERALKEVPNFSSHYKSLRRSVEISEKSYSTLQNFVRCLAHMGLHLKSDLLALDDDSITCMP